MGTKLLAFLCTVDNQGTYTSALCLYPKSKEPVCFRLVSHVLWTRPPFMSVNTRQMPKLCCCGLRTFGNQLNVPFVGEDKSLWM